MTFSRNAGFKRVVLPITMVLIFAALVGMLWVFTRGHLPWPWVAVPLILLIMVYRSIVICPSCGNTVRGRGFRARYPARAATRSSVVNRRLRTFSPNDPLEVRGDQLLRVSELRGAEFA